MAEKKLEDYPEVFTNIVNTLLFSDSSIHLDENKIIDGPTESIYKAEEKDKEQRRDTFKYYDVGNKGILFCVAAYGIENQSTIDNVMPVRIMNYDASAYKSQVFGLKSSSKQTNQKRKRIYPVITIVLNFSEKEWKTSRSLYDMMALPSDLAKYVQDYKINVFDVAFLEDDVIEKFTSDFKAVARFFKDKRLRLEANDTIEIKHPAEIADLFSVFTGDEGYRDAVPNVIKKKEKGEVITVCTYTETIRDSGKIEMLFELVESGDISPERACEKLGITLNELEKKMKDANFQFPRHYK
jgi:hypothetical protein